ncbi:TIGR03086 family metal-binding protein [Streptomyces sp. NPDC000594]|uniref:TIGR03086 family metal-binding protein n=1 Tax=Streptomyces sp. NPDC000594 TaxID=3154261 RepID=UPI00331A8175
MNDPRPLYARAVAQFAALVATVEQDQLDRPTPCAEFDVRALLDHVLMVTDHLAHVGEAGDWLTAPEWTRQVADDGWPAAFEEKRVRAIGVWADDARLAGEVSVPWGKVSGTAALGGYVLETVTHTWDLSRALGNPLPLDQELAEGLLPLARGFIGAEHRGGEIPFGPVREVPEDADAYDRLAGWLGREVPFTAAG